MNKLTKLLSVFVIAGAIGTGIAGVAGCNTSSDSHKHEYTYQQIAGDAEQHNKTCTAEGHKGDVTTKENHHFEGDKCKDCEYPAPEIADTVSVKLKTDISAVKAGQTIDLVAVVAGPVGTSQKITWTVAYGSDVVQIVDGTKLKALKFGDFGLTATPETDATKAADFDGHVINVSKYDQIAASDDCVVDSADLLKTDAATLPAPAVGTLGIYDYDGSSNAKIENGEASATGGIYVDFGTTKDVIEGNVVLNVAKESNTGFTLFRLATTGAKEIFGIKTNGKYRWNAGSDNNFTGNNYVKGNDYEVTFKYNKITNKLTVNLGTDQSVVVYDGIAGFTGEVTGLSIHTKANTENDLILLKKVAVATYDLTATEYATAKKADVAAIDTEAKALKGTSWTVAETETLLSSAKTTADTALSAADITKATADTALVTYKTSVLAALKAEYKARLAAAYPAADYANDPTEYNTKIAAANTAFDGVTEVGGFAEKYTEQFNILDEILTDAEKNSSKVTITLKINNDEGAEAGKINEAISGTAIPLADLVKAITVNTYLKKVEIYTDAAHSNKVTTGYTPTAAAGVELDTATLYVVLTDMDNTGTFTFTVGVKDDGYPTIYNQTDTEDIKAENLLDSENTVLSAADSSTFKLGSKGNQLVFNVEAKAGQVITLKMTGYSGSSDKDSAATYSATNATTSDTDGSYTFTAKGADETHNVKTVTYTATADGKVVITVARSSNTVKLDEVVITVADAAE